MVRATVQNCPVPISSSPVPKPIKPARLEQTTLNGLFKEMTMIN
jgi:hypothetical protein